MPTCNPVCPLALCLCSNHSNLRTIISDCLKHLSSGVSQGQIPRPKEVVTCGNRNACHRIVTINRKVIIVCTTSQPPRSHSSTQHSMPSRKPLLLGRRNVQSPSPPSTESSPNGASTSVVRRILPDRPSASQSVYPDYLNDIAGPGWDAALAVASIMEDIHAVPLALINPLTQVLDVVSGIRDAVKKMRDGKDGCTHLIFRVLKFLHSLVDGLKGRNIPDSTPTASSLFTLRRYVIQIPRTFSILKYNSFLYGHSNLMAIHADATRWSHLHLVKRYVQRDKIMTAISRHGDNLTDCLHTFQVSVYSIYTFSLHGNELMLS
jgi:hypothetical protein